MPELQHATVTAADLSANPIRGVDASRHVKKLAAMMDGYRSAQTEAAVAKIVTLLWILPAGAMALVGGLSLAGGATEDTNSWVLTIVGSSSLFALYSAVMGLWWLLRAWANTARLGRVPFLDVSRTVIEHGIAAIAAAALFAVAAVFEIPSLRIAGAVAALAAALIVPRLSIRAIDELWAISSPGLTEEDPTRRSWLYAALLVLTAASWGGIGRAIDADRDASGLAFAGGILLLVWVVVSIRLIHEITERQDTRLRTIVDGVQAAPSLERRRRTDAEVRADWNASEDLVGFSAESD